MPSPDKPRTATRPADDEQTKRTGPVARPDGGTTAGASPDDLDAPEYYAKDRKPHVGTPDESPRNRD